MGGHLRRTLVGLLAAGLAAAALPGAATATGGGAAATPAAGAGESAKRPFGDAGGFRNVLPPGSRGLTTAADLGPFFADGTMPRHWADQQPLYEGLLYASPRLTDGQVPTYFKDASFGVPPDQVESRSTPRPGVTIVRDKGYGVPHIYGRTRGDTIFGAGYAGAQDRLFLMDVLRHTGRAELASFLGGASLASDEAQWRFSPYSDADLRRQLRLAVRLYGAAGRRAVQDLRSYTAGVNAYIAAARRNPALMPVEYRLIGAALRDWRATDVIATASLIGGIFGRGGGGEVASAAVLRALQQRFGREEGRLLWSVFRNRDDPQAPTTASARFGYMNRNPFSRRGLALPAAGSVEPVQVIAERTGGVSASSSATGGDDWGSWVREALRGATSSNWELIARRKSTTGSPIAVMGPQVGYFLPQILMEMDLHGPGIDARGVAFAGVNLYVQMGRGRDYAWSATSAGSDNVDTFAEVLCGGDRFHYRYRGRCRPMDKLTRQVSWRPNAADRTPAGSATLTAYRTVHGIVQSYGRVRGKAVAFAAARSTYMHEADSVLGFARLNNPRAVTGPRGFRKAAQSINFTFNWAYADADHIAYYLSGAYPVDAPGTSPDLPVLGTGKYDWRGFRPRTRTARMIATKRHPQATDPDFLVSWNNKPAPGWAAADDQWGYGPIYRSDLIADRVRAGLRGGRRMGPADLVRAMSEPATQDIRGVALLPLLLRALRDPADPALRSAMATLRSWHQSGAHRRDLDRDGTYDDAEAVQIMDAWWPLLVEAQFRPALGDEAFAALTAVIGLGDRVGGTPAAPGFADGWWGYVLRDLRALYRPDSVPGTYPRVFCGRGSTTGCAGVLRRSLQQALAVTPEQLYGRGACAADPQPDCFDANRSRVTGAINEPGAAPFQNRPTFQQVVSVGHDFGVG